MSCAIRMSHMHIIHALPWRIMMLRYGMYKPHVPHAFHPCACPSFGGFGHLIYGDTYDIQALYPIRIGLHRRAVHALITRHVHIHPEIISGTTAFWAQRMRDVDYTIAIHYRGLDSKFHYPYYNIPYETMVRKDGNTWGVWHDACGVLHDACCVLRIACDMWQHVAT